MSRPEDIIVYSIDEVFMDVTRYLKTYGLSPHELAMKIILDVLATTGITATAGIGTNLYLCKVAMDIVAKHIPADENGVRIAELDERSYREKLWAHTPLTDFWRVGRGYAKKLEENGMFTMGDVARRSLTDEDALFKLFGKNAELLIDHAWGYEPCTVEAVKAYKPSTNSLGSGQVLHEPYTAEKARIVLREMADALSMDLFAKKLVTDQIDAALDCIENIKDAKRRAQYKGEIVRDGYGAAEAQALARDDKPGALHVLDEADNGRRLGALRPRCGQNAAHTAAEHHGLPRHPGSRRAEGGRARADGYVYGLRGTGR